MTLRRLRGDFCLRLSLFRAEETKGRLVIVADECGLGIVAPDPVARRFAEFSGILNRRLAAAAAKAVLVVGGLPMPLK